MSVDDENTEHRHVRETAEEELGEVGVGTDGSLHSTHETQKDEEREGYGVGTDGSLDSAEHLERDRHDSE
jgi:hypothetical protein